MYCGTYTSVVDQEIQSRLFAHELCSSDFDALEILQIQLEEVKIQRASVMFHVGDGLVDTVLRSTGDVDTGAALGELQGCLIADTRVTLSELVR